MAELEIKPTVRMRSRVLALIALAGVLISVLIYLLVGGGADFFARRATVLTYMPDATGIAKGSEVRLSGIRIGKVQKVEISGLLDPSRAVRVDMRVLARNLANIPADSQTAISADTLVGYGFVDIQEGKSPLPIQDGQALHSEPVKAAADRADLMKTVQQNLAQVDQIIAEISSGQTKIGQFVLGEQEYDSVLASIRGFDQALHTFITPRGKLGQAFYSSEAYDKIHGVVLQTDKALSSLQSGNGAAGQLLANDRQYVDLLRSLSELHQSLVAANSGNGAFASLLNDDAGYRRISRLLAATDATITSLNAGEGQAGRLLANPQLYESLNGSLRSLEALLRDLREDPRKYLRLKIF